MSETYQTHISIISPLQLPKTIIDGNQTDLFTDLNNNKNSIGKLGNI